ncbi:MAG TPA: hybrid sensor histidine kinase/response regulator [Roseiflexaceae bacterium]|nr:hybrid sensor histidine kinase/response regulator [Roseiflexaceae bacterium]
MWQTQSPAASANTAIADSTRELFRSTMRAVILMLSAIYLAWHLVATVVWPNELGDGMWVLSAVFAPLSFAALWLLPRWPVLAQALWQGGLAVLIVLAVLIFKRPEPAFLAALLTLMAVVSAGWLAGLLAQVLVTALAFVLSQGLFDPALSPAYATGVVVGAAIAGLLGWAATRALATMAHWSFSGYAQAQAHAEQAQNHRAELAQTLKALDHAYYRLGRANAALVAARKQAEEAERFRAEFVANVSHELRTPLNLIVGFSEVIATSPESYGVPLPGPYRSDLNAIYRSAQHLLALVDDVLDLARIEAGKITLVREEVELTGLVADVADTMRDYINAKGLELRLHVDPDLPRLRIDRLRIRQVLLNLLVNAARFTERGYLAIGAVREGDRVVLRVSDTGRGIPAQDLPMIFEEFRSTEQPVSAWHSGTGLGLPISKKFVTLHQGEMGVESVVGQGTTFWIRLPVQAGAAPERGAGAPGRWQPLVPLGSAERIVVVVHEDAHVVGLLQRHLDGYRVLGAPAVAEGVALAEETQAIGLVVDGTGELPAAPAELPVFRCPLPSSRHAAVAMGATALLTKPVDRQDLLQAVERLQRPIQRVLIVDDDPKMAQLLQRMLHSHLPAKSCLAAYDGAEALRLLHAERPDLVLLDLHMQGVDGRAVLEYIGRAPELAATPVIIISGQGQDYLNVPLSGAIQLSREPGFRLGEVIQVMDALFTALAPGWRQLDSKGPARAEAPAD